MTEGLQQQLARLNDEGCAYLEELVRLALREALSARDNFVGAEHLNRAVKRTADTNPKEAR